MQQLKDLVRTAKELNALEVAETDIDTNVGKEELANQITEFAKYVLDPEVDELTEQSILVLESLRCSPYPSVNNVATEPDDLNEDGEEDPTDTVVDKTKPEDEQEEKPEDEPEEVPEEKPEPKKKRGRPKKETTAEPKKEKEEDEKESGKKNIMQDAERLLMKIVDEGGYTNKDALKRMVDEGIKYNTAKTLLWTSKVAKHNRLPRQVTLDSEGCLTFVDKL